MAKYDQDQLKEDATQVLMFAAIRAMEAGYGEDDELPDYLLQIFSRVMSVFWNPDELSLRKHMPGATQPDDDPIFLASLDKRVKRGEFD